MGAGIIGSSIACYLARGGADVTIIEALRPGCDATSKSFGWINANFSEDHNYFKFREASIQEYRVLEKQFEKPCNLAWGGSLWWELEGIEYDNHIKGLESFNYPLKEIDATEFSVLEPHIAAPPERSTHFFNEGAVDPISCSKAMLDLAKKAGASLIIGCKAQELIFQGHRCTGVKTSEGDFYGDTTVVALGVNAQPFLARSNIQLPMKNGQGLIIHTRAVEPVLNHLVLSPNLHFRQQRNGSIVAAANYFGSELNQDPISTANDILARLKQHLANLNGLEIAEITIGTRPVPKDGYPVIGYPKNHPGLYITSMHSGVTLAPIVGKLACEEILGNISSSNTLTPLLDPFRIERFARE